MAVLLVRRMLAAGNNVRDVSLSRQQRLQAQAAAYAEGYYIASGRPGDTAQQQIATCFAPFSGCESFATDWKASTLSMAPYRVLKKLACRVSNCIGASTESAEDTDAAAQA